MSNTGENAQSENGDVSRSMLDASRVSVRENDRGQLVLQVLEGGEYEDVRVIPAFPISRPNRFVYFLDGEGNEIGLLEDPRRMDRESRDLVLAQADQAYFMPKVTRVVNVEERPGSGFARWDVDTDRGPSSFEVVSRSESVWWVGKNRVVIRDADGNRYLIEDLSALDKRSRRLTDLYL
ncbi:MAG: DUF1854 domain-containing protein [Armatimonadetes bacterium]|nr:DUF1854 domain-containing protein [Armatimonadota bacterium]